MVDETVKPISSDRWDRECLLITRYLVGENPSDELKERFRSGNGLLLSSGNFRSDEAVVSFMISHPWSLPYLDAASALVRPTGLLRSKILLMVSLLETHPGFTRFFFPRSDSKARVVLKLIGLGFLSGLKACLGLMIYPIAARNR